MNYKQMRADALYGIQPMGMHLAFDWPIFLDLMEYANQIQEVNNRYSNP